MFDSTQPPEPRVSRLVEIQQGLLSLGYRFTDADVKTWPMSMAMLAREEELVQIGPWGPGPSPRMAETFNQFARQHPAGGVVLVGLDDMNGPEVQDFLAATSGTVAYVEAISGRYTLRRRKASLLTGPPAILKEENFPRLLAPASQAAARIDARAEMEKAMADAKEADEFHQQTRQAGGGRQPVVTMAVMAVCIGIFAAQFIMGNLRQAWSIHFFNLLALHGPSVQHGQWWQIITSGFLHADQWHILMNMMALYYLGRLIEAFQGHWRMGAYFLFTVVMGNLLSLWWDPLVHGVGASGGIFGLMGAMGAMILRHRRDFPPAVWKSLKGGLVSTLLINVVFFFVPYVNGSAHVGGLVGGFLLGLVISRSPTKPRSPSSLAWLATAALLTATVAFGSYTVRTIPLEGQNKLTRKHRLYGDIMKWLIPASKPASRNDTDENER